MLNNSSRLFHRADFPSFALLIIEKKKGKIIEYLAHQLESERCFHELKRKEFKKLPLFGLLLTFTVNSQSFPVKFVTSPIQQVKKFCLSDFRTR